MKLFFLCALSGLAVATSASPVLSTSCSLNGSVPVSGQTTPPYDLSSGCNVFDASGDSIGAEVSRSGDHDPRFQYGFSYEGGAALNTRKSSSGSATVSATETDTLLASGPVRAGVVVFSLETAGDYYAPADYTESELVSITDGVHTYELGSCAPAKNGFSGCVSGNGCPGPPDFTCTGPSGNLPIELGVPIYITTSIDATASLH